jgi:deoxyribonuclease-4
MLNIGCHLSVAAGYHKAGLRALEIGANSFQFFTRNPRGGKAKALDQSDLDALERLMKENKFSTLFAHASYTMNLCSDKEDTRAYALDVLKDDLKRLKQIPNALYIFHPGSHVKQGPEKAIEFIVNALNESISENEDIWICLEGMSGKGTEVGRNFEELAAIIKGVKNNEKLGVCLDTCHLYSAGYDIVNDLDGVLEHFDKTIGLDRLRAFHLNDSKVDYASHKDRHEKIGHGSIGLEALLALINHEKLKHLTFNLETPNENEGYKKEIELLRSRFK